MNPELQFVLHVVLQPLTCNPCAVAKLERVPDHGPVRNWEEGLGVLIGVGCEGRERTARATQDQSLEARRRNCDGVGHRKRADGSAVFAKDCPALVALIRLPSAILVRVSS